MQNYFIGAFIAAGQEEISFDVIERDIRPLFSDEIIIFARE